MTVVELLILLVVAGIIGSIGQSIAGASRGGFLAAIAVGFIGGLLGVWLARKLEMPELFILEIGDTKLPIVWSIIGSTLFVAVVSFLSRGRT